MLFHARDLLSLVPQVFFRCFQDIYISCLHKKEKMQANKIKKVYKGISPKSSENKEKGRQKRPFSGAADRT